ncbi:MAG TPA: GNAT family N-acetyltransferase [Polyangia bacterium]|nr:GNAT family N-acetyltransferase [Polyangia bacterium]
MLEAFDRLEQIDWDEAVVAPALRRLVGEPSLGHVGVVEVEGRPAGYFVVTWGYDLEWGGRDSFLTDLYLEPEARGLGVGARVLASIEEVARAGGAAALHLMVRPENEPAVRLYARAGFRSPPRTLLSKRLRP